MAVWTEMVVILMVMVAFAVVVVTVPGEEAGKSMPGQVESLVAWVAFWVAMVFLGGMAMVEAVAEMIFPAAAAAAVAFPVALAAAVIFLTLTAAMAAAASSMQRPQVAPNRAAAARITPAAVISNTSLRIPSPP